MDTGQTIVLAGATVVLGKWISGERLEPKFFIGAAGAAVGLSVLSQADPKLSNRFAMIILVSALLIYGERVAKKVVNPGSKTGAGAKNASAPLNKNTPLGVV